MVELNWLQHNSTDFPALQAALVEPNGLLAVGGDLSHARLLEAYRRGIFPWYEEDQPIMWWSPDPRSVLFLDELHVSRSLRKIIRQNDFTVRIDHDFPQVISNCAGPRRNGDGTWITSDVFHSFVELHEMGVSHSVEVWRQDQLVGGLYGIAMGKIFFGESMFSRQPNMSKIALYYLVQKLIEDGFALIDCQVHNDHLATMGAREIPRSVFVEQLENTIDSPLTSNWSRF